MPKYLQAKDLILQVCHNFCIGMLCFFIKMLITSVSPSVKDNKILYLLLFLSISSSFSFMKIADNWGNISFRCYIQGNGVLWVCGRQYDGKLVVHPSPFMSIKVVCIG